MTNRLAELAQMFPGGVPSRTVREQQAEREAAPTNGWDSQPKIITIKGVDHEFFYVSALAKALGRSTKAVYKWEDNGWLPQSRYRTKAKQTNLPDKAAAGRRLYTRKQIEAVIDAAKQTDVFEVSRRTTPDWDRFTQLVAAAWSR